MSYVTIYGITWKNTRGYNPLLAASMEWNATHPGYKVVWEQKNWYEFEHAVIESLSAEDGRYDLIMYDHPWVGTLVDNGWLLPLEAVIGERMTTDVMKRAIPPSADSYYLGGSHYAFPVDAACHVGMSRTDMVNNTAIPEYWEELETWAKSVKSKSLPYPIVLSVEGVLGSCMFLTLMASLDAPAFHSQNVGDFDPEAARYALDILGSLITYCPPDSTHWGPWDIYLAMATQPGIGYSPSIFGYVNYFETEPYGQYLSVVAPPSFTGYAGPRPILGGVGLGLSHHAQTRDHFNMIVDYALFQASDDVQLRTSVENNGQPAARLVWESQHVNARFKNFYKESAKAMKQAYIRPRYPGFHERELAIGRALQPFWDGAIDSAQAVRALKKL